MRRMWARLTAWLFGYDAFISYTHSDGLPYAVELERRLVAKGYRVFRDAPEMPVGTTLDAAIKAGLKNTHMLVVVDTVGSRASEWVELELAHFHGLHPKRPIVGVVLADTEPTRPLLAKRVWARDAPWPRDPPAPSDTMVDRIVAQRTYRLASKAAFRSVVTVAVVLAVMLVSVVFLYLEAGAARDEAERRAKAEQIASAARSFALADVATRDRDSDDVMRGFLGLVGACVSAPADDAMRPTYVAALGRAARSMPSDVAVLDGPKRDICDAGPGGRFVEVDAVLTNELWDLHHVDRGPLNVTPDEGRYGSLSVFSPRGDGVIVSDDGIATFLAFDDARRVRLVTAMDRLDNARWFDGAGRIVVTERSASDVTIRLSWPETELAYDAYTWSPKLDRWRDPQLLVSPSADHPFFLWTEPDPNAGIALVLVPEAWQSLPRTLATMTSVAAMEVSPNGRFIAVLGVVDDTKRVLLFDAEGATRGRFAAPEATRVVVGDDGASCACGGPKEGGVDCHCRVGNATLARKLRAGARLEPIAGGRVFGLFDTTSETMGLWDPMADDELWRSPPTPEGQLELTPDATTLLVLSNKGTLFQWYLPALVPALRTLSAANSVDAAAFSPDCRRVVTFRGSGEIRSASMFSAESGALAWTRELGTVPGRIFPVITLEHVWSTDSARLALVSHVDDWRVVVLGASDGRIIKERVFEREVFGVRLTDDGLVVAIKAVTDFLDGRVRLGKWLSKSAKPELGKPVEGGLIDFSQDGERAAVLVGDPNDRNRAIVIITDAFGETLWTAPPSMLHADGLKTLLALKAFVQGHSVDTSRLDAIGLVLPSGRRLDVQRDVNDPMFTLDGGRLSLPRTGRDQFDGGAFALAPTGSWFAAARVGDASKASGLRLWDARTAAPLGDAIRSAAKVRAVCATPDGTLFRALTSTGQLIDQWAWPSNAGPRPWLSRLGPALTGHVLDEGGVRPLSRDELVHARAALRALLVPAAATDELARVILQTWSGAALWW